MSTPLRLRSTANVQSYKVSLIGKDGNKRVINYKPANNSSTASTSRRNTTVHSAIERSLGGSRPAQKSTKSSKRASKHKSPSQSPRGSTHNAATSSSGKKEQKSDDVPQITTTFLDETYRDLRGRFNRLRTQRSNSSASESFCEHVEGCTGVGCSCPRGTEKITSTKIGGTNCDYVQETIIERSMMTENGVQTTTKHIIKRCDKNGHVEVEVEESKHVSGQSKSYASDTAYEVPSTSQQQDNKSQSSQYYESSLAQSQNIGKEKRNPNATSAAARTQGSALSGKVSFSQILDHQSMPSLPPSNTMRRGGYIQVDRHDNLDMQSMPSMPPSSPSSRVRQPTYCAPNHSPLECCPCICNICANYISQKLSLPLDRLDQQTLNSLVVRRPQDGRPTLDYFRVGEMLQARAVEQSAAQVRASQSQSYQVQPPARRADTSIPVSIKRPRRSTVGAAHPRRGSKYPIAPTRLATDATPSKSSKSLSDMALSPQGITKGSRAPRAVPSEQLADVSEPSFYSGNFDYSRAQQQTAARPTEREPYFRPQVNNRCPVIPIPLRASTYSRKRSKSLCDIVQPIYRSFTGPPTKKPFLNEPFGNACEPYHSDSSNGSAYRCNCRGQYSQRYEPASRMPADPSRREECVDYRPQMMCPCVGERGNYIEKRYGERQPQAYKSRQPPFQPESQLRQDFISTEDQLAQSRYAERGQGYSSREEDYYRVSDSNRYPDPYPSRFSNRSQYKSDERGYYNEYASRFDDSGYRSEPVADRINPDDHVISSGMPSLTEERLRSEAAYRDRGRPDGSLRPQTSSAVEQKKRPTEDVADVSASRGTPLKRASQADDNARPSKVKRPSQTGECLNRQRPSVVSKLHRSLQHMQLSVNIQCIEGITKELPKPVHQISHTGKELSATTTEKTKTSDGGTQITQTKVIEPPPSGGSVIAEIIIPMPLIEVASPTDQLPPTEEVVEAENEVVFTASVRSIPGSEIGQETIIVSSQVEIKPRQKSITFKEDEEIPQLRDGDEEQDSALLFSRQRDMPESQADGYTTADDSKEPALEDIKSELETKSYTTAEDSKAKDDTESLVPEEIPIVKPEKSEYTTVQDSSAYGGDSAIEAERPDYIQMDESRPQEKRDIEPARPEYTTTEKTGEYVDESEIETKVESYTIPDKTREIEQKTPQYWPVDDAKEDVQLKGIEPRQQSFVDTRGTSAGSPNELRRPEPAPTDDQRRESAQKGLQIRRPSFGAARTSLAAKPRGSRTPASAATRDSKTYDARREIAQRRASYVPGDGSGPSRARALEPARQEYGATQDTRAYEEQNIDQPRRPSYVPTEDFRTDRQERQTYAPAEDVRAYEPRAAETQRFVDPSSPRTGYDDSFKPEYPPIVDSRPYDRQAAGPRYSPTKDYRAYDEQRAIESRPDRAREVEPAKPAYAPAEGYRSYDERREIQPQQENYLADRPYSARQIEPERPRYAPFEDSRAYEEQRRIDQAPQGYQPPVVSRPDARVEPARTAYAPIEDYRPYDEPRRIDPGPQGYPPPMVSRPSGARQVEPARPMYAPVDDYRSYDGQRRSEQRPQGYPPPDVYRSDRTRPMEPTRPQYAPFEDSRAYDRQRTIEQGPQSYPPPDYSGPDMATRPAYVPIEDFRAYDRQRSIEHGRQVYAAAEPTRQMYAPPEVPRAYNEQRDYAPGRQTYGAPEREIRTQTYAAPDDGAFYRTQEADSYQQARATDKPLAMDTRRKDIGRGSQGYGRAQQTPTGKRQSAAPSDSKTYGGQRGRLGSQAERRISAARSGSRTPERKALADSKSYDTREDVARTSDGFRSDAESRKQKQPKIKQEPKTSAAVAAADAKPSKSRKETKDSDTYDRKDNVKGEQRKEETESESQDNATDSEKEIKATKSKKEVKKPSAKADDKRTKPEESSESESQDYSSERELKKPASKEASKRTDSEESTESESEDYSSDESKAPAKPKVPRYPSSASTSKAKMALPQRKSIGSQRRGSIGHPRLSQMAGSKIPLIFCYDPPPRCPRPCAETVVYDPCRRPCDLSPCRRPCELDPCCSPCRTSAPICQPAAYKSAVCKPTVCPASAKRPSARSSKIPKTSKSKKRSSSKKSK